MIINLLDLFVKIAVNDEASDKVKTIAGNIGNGLKTAAKIGTAAIGTAVAGISALTTASINQYAELEQLAGGAELLYGDAYDFVQDKAKDAYKNVQLTQSEYLKQVNGFSTGLKTALGGNAQAAAELADRIITAEADVVAATGASQEAVQNAFNGIMKSNFTMLDNLQLGINPTKEGFQEVIDKVNEWNTANGKATQYQMGNLADMQSALVDYVEMQGLANYAAMEGTKTISGSFSSLKAAVTNLITGMSDESADLPALVDNVVESALAFGENLLPRVEVALIGAVKLIEGLFPQIVEMLPGLIETTLPSILNGALLIIETLVSSLDQNKESIIPAAFALIMTFASSILDLLPDILRIGMELLIEVARGISSALPELLPVLVEVIRKIATILTNVDSVRELTGAALDIIVALAEGLGTAIPELVDVIIMIVDNIVTMLLDPENTAKLVNAALRIIIAIGGGLIAAIPELALSVKSLIDSVIENFKNTDWGEAGRTIIDGLLDGIKAAWSNITEWFSNAWSGLGDLFSGWFDGDVDNKKTGSHAGGLSYVPRSGDLYELHQGEMVLTADEARRYRQDRNNIGYVQQSSTPVNVVMQVDKTTLGRLVFDLNNNQEYINGYNIAEVPG